MPQSKPALNASIKLIDESGLSTSELRFLLVQLIRSVPLVGSGDPEGALLADQYALYVDEADPLTPVQYRKMLPQIAGDRRKGWVQI